MNTENLEPAPYDFLAKAALSLGATDAKIIRASDIVVENRVPLKCRAGCIGYGKKLTCPPHVPTPDEFRKILAEYRYALLVKYLSPATAEPDVICSIYKYWLDPGTPDNLKEKATGFWKDHFDGTGSFAPLMFEIERIAFNVGNQFPSRSSMVHAVCARRAMSGAASASTRHRPGSLSMR